MERQLQVCGFCGGSGRVRCSQRDAYGPRPDYPEWQTCDYCDGTGCCERGGDLLPQGEVYQATDEDRERAGSPPWA